MRHAAGNIQRTANDLQRATCNMHQAANNNGMQHNMQHAVRNMQHISNSVQRETCNMRQTSCNMQRTTTTCDATCNKQRAACNKPQTTLQRQRATDNRQEGNIHQAACGMQQIPRRKPHSKQPGTGNGKRMQQTTDNRQQTTCKRTRAHARCNKNPTAPPRFVCGGQRRTSSMREALYAATSAQQGTDAQDATNDRGRNMQQTRMKIHGVR